MTNVNANALAGRAERAKGIANIDINLTGVGLGGNDVRRLETSLLGDQLIQLLNLLMVALEDLEERGLSTGGTLDTTEAQIIASPLEVLQVHEQVLDPQGGTLSDGNKLSGLSVGEAQAGQVLVLLSEGRQLVNDNSKLGDKDIESVTEEDQVCVVGAVAGGGAPVDDSGSSRSDLTIGMDVSHDIVSTALLLLSGNLEFVVLNGEVSLHLLNGLVGDRQTQLCTG